MRTYKAIQFDDVIVQTNRQMERETGTCLRGKSQEKKTISVSLTVQFTVRTSPCFNTLLDTVRSTSITLGTEKQTGGERDRWVEREIDRSATQ